ncbi:MAG: hypothetical protein KDD61_11290 [Bdellovibrionales bacterium]|nr:hypothetical protein [Bdellovibrionales bacterium]
MSFLKSRQRALIAMTFSWAVFFLLAHTVQQDYRSLYVELFNDESLKLEMDLDVAEQQYLDLIHSFDKATRQSSPRSFLNSLKHFHVLNAKLYSISIADRSLRTEELEARARELAQKTVKHFISPFNEQIKKVDASIDNGSQRSVIKQFVADYDEFQLIHQGPFSLGQVEPLTTHIIGL